MNICDKCKKPEDEVGPLARLFTGSYCFNCCMQAMGEEE
jgi:hypothetical protein